MLTAASIVATALGLVLAVTGTLLVGDAAGKLDRQIATAFLVAASLSTSLGWLLAAGIA